MQAVAERSAGTGQFDDTTVVVVDVAPANANRGTSKTRPPRCRHDPDHIPELALKRRQ